MTSHQDAPLAVGFASGTSPRLPVDRIAALEARSRVSGQDDESRSALAAECRTLHQALSDKPKSTGIGWKLGLAVDLALLAMPIPAVIVIPPLLECRHISRNVGFFRAIPSTPAHTAELWPAGSGSMHGSR